MRVVWLPRAERDPETLYTAVAEENPSAALDLLTRIDTVVPRLGEFPSMGRPGRVTGTRELVVDGTPYILPYRVRNRVVQILRVLHGARRWPQRF
jgi:toxin ParE1/3/4